MQGGLFLIRCFMSVQQQLVGDDQGTVFPIFFIITGGAASFTVRGEAVAGCCGCWWVMRPSRFLFAARTVRADMPFCGGFLYVLAGKLFPVCQ